MNRNIAQVIYRGVYLTFAQSRFRFIHPQATLQLPEGRKSSFFTLLILPKKLG